MSPQGDTGSQHRLWPVVHTRQVNLSDGLLTGGTMSTLWPKPYLCPTDCRGSWNSLTEQEALMEPTASSSLWRRNTLAPVSPSCACTQVPAHRPAGCCEKLRGPVYREGTRTVLVQITLKAPPEHCDHRHRLPQGTSGKESWKLSMTHDGFQRFLTDSAQAQ